ncbi:MAG: amidohydrolase family protein [Planctomycetes bacterium]|nr:amidohydrolase family protein [Planctomycetota bacterium]
MLLRTLLGSALACAALSSAAPAQDALAIRAGKVLTMTGKDLENVVILVENGRITAISDEVKPAWNAKVIDATDKVVMPAWVLAHTSGGLSGGDVENMLNVPYLTVKDALDPASLFVEEALRNGVGTFHVMPGNRTMLGGTGMVARPYGKTVEDMTVLSRTALKLSLASAPGQRTTQIRRLQRALQDVREYLEDFERRKKEFEEEKAAGAAGDKKEFGEEPDAQKKPVIELLQGKLRGYLYVPGPAEVPEALRLANTAKLDLVLVLGWQCWRAARALTNLKNPVVLDPDLEAYDVDPETDTETLVCAAAELAKQGVPFALSIDTGTDGPQRFPWWQAATLVRHGVDRNIALAALTTVPAKLLGLADQVGTVEVGKVANLQILTGDPLKATTWVDQVVLEGQLAYERSKDRRLQHLFGKNDPGQAQAK